MEKFDVMFTSDNKYIDIMLASIYSFLLNSNLENIRIHIIASNFSLDDYKRVENFIKLFSDVEIYFYPFENFDIEKYNIPNWRGGQISNSRLFFQDILKSHISNIKNLLYLDSDTITVSDLTELNKYKDGLYACKDGCLHHYYKSLNDLDTYYNSGVILINVNEWLENNYKEKIIETLQDTKIKFTFPDQDIFNCALKDYIRKLPINYNVSPHVYAFNDFFSKIYYNSKYRNIGYQDAKAAKNDPKIIHSYGFSGIKPWNGKFNPYYDEYMKYILEVNPYFKADELDDMKEKISKFPHLYRILLLTRTYLSEEMEKPLRSLALKCQQNTKKNIQ